MERPLTVNLTTGDIKIGDYTDKFDPIYYVGAHQDVLLSGISSMQDTIQDWITKHGIPLYKNPRRLDKTKSPKVAIICTGYLRNYTMLFSSTQMNEFLTSYDADVYFSVWSSYGKLVGENVDENIKEEEIKALFMKFSRVKNVYVDIEKRGKLPPIPIIKSKCGEPRIIPQDGLTICHENMYKIFRCVKMIKEHASYYDAVLYLRPDFIFQEKLELEQCFAGIYEHKLYLPFLLHGACCVDDVLPICFVCDLSVLKILTYLYELSNEEEFIRKYYNTSFTDIFINHLQKYEIHTEVMPSVTADTQMHPSSFPTPVPQNPQDQTQDQDPRFNQFKFCVNRTNIDNADFVLRGTKSFEDLPNDGYHYQYSVNILVIRDECFYMSKNDLKFVSILSGVTPPIPSPRLH